MEKRKLLLVAVSVGVFLVIVLSAAILIFTPTAGGAAVAAARPEGGASQPVGPGSAPISQRGPASADATDMVRNAGDLQGLQTPPAASAVQENNIYINGEDPSVVISVPRPSTPGVPAPGTRPAAPAGSSVPAVPVVPAVPAGVSAGNATAAQTTPAQTTPATPAQQTTPAAPSTPTVAAKPPAAPAAAKSTAGASTPARASPAPAPVVTPAAARTTPSRVQNDYWIQTGAFSALVRAEGVKETLASKGLSSIIDDRDVEGQTWYRVRIGPYTSENEANYWLALVKAIDGFSESQVRSTQR